MAKIRKEQIEDTVLGYAQAVAPQSSITTVVDLTNLSVTVNVPVGGRKIKITGWLPQIYSSVETDRYDLNINEGSTIVTSAYGSTRTASSGAGGVTILAVIIPTAGNHTYKLTLARTSGTGFLSVYAASAAPSFILVELL